MKYVYERQAPVVSELTKTLTDSEQLESILYGCKSKLLVKEISGSC